jgi:hypothetical protein
MASEVEMDSPGPSRPDLSNDFDDSEFFNELDEENEAEQLLQVRWDSFLLCANRRCMFARSLEVIHCARSLFLTI